MRHALSSHSVSVASAGRSQLKIRSNGLLRGNRPLTFHNQSSSIDQKHPRCVICAINLFTRKKQEESTAPGEFGRVKGIISSRPGPEGTIEYLVEWADGSDNTWEPEQYVAVDLVREYNGTWWDSAKSGNIGDLTRMIEEEGRDVNLRDADKRTALMYCAGLGRVDAVEGLIDLGASTRLADKDGYTPLHLAAGYVNVAVVEVLLKAGADPEAPDNDGRSVLDLVIVLQKNAPLDPLQFTRRMQLGDIRKKLEDNLYEDVDVEAIIEKRMEGFKIEYLVRWADSESRSDEWIPVDCIHPELVKDYEEGLEYAEVESILERRVDSEGKEEFLVRWSDDSLDSWEPRDNLGDEICDEFMSKATESSSS